MWSAAAASLFAVTSMLHAADDAQMRNIDNRLTALEQRKSANGMINPNGRPQVKDGANLFITADFLYWVANEGGLGFVVKSQAHHHSIADGKLKSPGFKWEPGFRVGLGYNLPHDGWDLYTDWTWLISRAERTVTADHGERLYPTFMNINEITGENVRSATGKWKNHLNMMDLEIGRQFFVSKWLTVRPHIGLRNAWVYQHLNLDYCGEFNVGDVGCFSSSSSSSSSSLCCNSSFSSENGQLDGDHACKYWGMGLRGGLNTQWGLGCGMSFYGDLALSLLFGRFHINETERFSPHSGSDFKTFDWKDKYTACRGVVDLAAGLRWDENFHKDRFHFRLQAGWEQHLFINQNQFDRVVSSTVPGITVTNQGDLSFNGVTISTRFDF